MDRAPGEQGKKTAQKDAVCVHVACRVWPELMEKADPQAGGTCGDNIHPGKGNAAAPKEPHG